MRNSRVRSCNAYLYGYVIHNNATHESVTNAVWGNCWKSSHVHGGLECTE